MPKKAPSRSRANLRVKRVYDPADDGDGMRVLVDRLWPRGLTKEKARIDLWVKDVAPSDDLRRRFHAKPEEWEEFRKAYAQELSKAPAAAALKELKQLMAKGPVTLLFAARDDERNNAIALLDWLRSR